MYDVRQTLRCAPDSFYALPLNQSADLAKGENFFLKKFPLEEHGNQNMVEQHYRWFDGFDSIFDFPRGEHPLPVATFSRLLRGQYGNSFVKVIRALNDLLKSYFGTNVDFEGSADFIRGQDGKWRSVIYPLQARTQIRSDMGRVKELPQVAEKNVLLRVGDAVGRGNQKFRDIIYVPPEMFNFSTAFEIAQELRDFGMNFDESRRYLLLVPGRFGSTDWSLGIPADYGAAKNAVAVVEYMKGNWEPSQGTHMFEAMVGSGKALLHYKDGQLKLDNFKDQAVGVRKGAYLEHYTFDRDFELLIDDEQNCLIHMK